MFGFNPDKLCQTRVVHLRVEFYLAKLIALRARKVCFILYADIPKLMSLQSGTTVWRHLCVQQETEGR